MSRVKRTRADVERGGCCVSSSCRSMNLTCVSCTTTHHALRHLCSVRAVLLVTTIVPRAARSLRVRRKWVLTPLRDCIPLASAVFLVPDLSLERCFLFLSSSRCGCGTRCGRKSEGFCAVRAAVPSSNRASPVRAWAPCRPATHPIRRRGAPVHDCCAAPPAGAATPATSAESSASRWGRNGVSGHAGSYSGVPWRARPE